MIMPVGGFKVGEMAMLSAEKTKLRSNQRLAFFVAWGCAQGGMKVKLFKENGVWQVIVK